MVKNIADFLAVNTANKSPILFTKYSPGNPPGDSPRNSPSNPPRSSPRQSPRHSPSSSHPASTQASSHHHRAWPTVLLGKVVVVVAWGCVCVCLCGGVEAGAGAWCLSQCSPRPSLPQSRPEGLCSPSPIVIHPCLLAAPHQHPLPTPGSQTVGK